MRKLALLMALLGMFVVSASGCAFLAGAGAGAVAAEEVGEEERCDDDDFDPMEEGCD